MSTSTTTSAPANRAWVLSLLLLGSLAASSAAAELIWRERLAWNSSSGVNAVAFSANGKVLAAGGSDARDTVVRFWTVENGRQAGSVVEQEGITALKYASHGMELIVGTVKKVVVLDTKTGKKSAPFRGLGARVNSLDSSRDGKLLVAAGWDGKIRLWDIKTHKLLDTFGQPNRDYHSVAFSPDGKTLVSGSGTRGVQSDPGEVTLWDTGDPTKRMRRRLLGHSGEVRAVAVSPDGSLLASGSVETQTCDGNLKGELFLWDPKTGRKLRALVGHNAKVMALAFSPDGKLLASASQDRMVRLWDPATGKLLATLRGHKDVVTCLAFSPDGKLLASGSDDATVKLWERVK